MDKRLSILIIEDSESDAGLVIREFHKANYEITAERVETADGMRSALARQSWDLIISDYNLPEFDAPAALTIFRESGLDIPFIVVSGAIGEETAVAIMIAGAHDYVMKGNLIRLIPAAERELGEAQMRHSKRLAEVALRTSEEKYRLIADNADDWVYWAAPDGTLRYISPSCERVTGYHSTEFINHPQLIQGISYPEDKETVDHHFAKLREEHKPDYLEFRIVTKTGEVRWISHSCSPIYTEEGKYAGRRITNRNITERKLAEGRLVESESRYKVLIENSGTGIVIIDGNGTYQYANKKAADWFGGGQEEIVGKSMFDLLPYQTAQNYLEANRSLIESGGSREYEDTFLLQGDQRTFLKVDQCIQDAGGRNYAIQSCSIDITGRRRAEEALRDSQRLLAETQNIGKVGGWEFDIDTGKQTWTEEIYKIHEVDPAYEPTVEKGINFYTPASRQTIEEVLLRAVEHGEEFDVELEIISAKGNFRNVHVIGKADLEHRRVYGFFHDITKRKWAEAELQFSYRQLRALAARLQHISEEERVGIARAVHDELGGGLAGLKMNLLWLLQLIEDGNTGDIQKAPLIDQIHEATRTADGLIQTVRRIATELRPSVLDDLGLISALEWQLEEFRKRTKKVFEFATTFEDLRLEKETTTGVFRIFQEALTNVAQHSDATKVTVSLGKDDESLFLEITDNGKGINRREMLGTAALGILGMKERALLFGGSVTVTGRPGRGTAVLVRIPSEQKEAP